MQVADIPAAERVTGYWVDLESYQLDEGKDSGWIQMFPLGEYKHPVYGKISMTVERARRMAHNIVQRVRGIDIAIDYAHKNMDKAAGWVKSAEVRPDGLWGFVEWTKEAAEGIRNKEWRYFSPEFVDEWTNPQGQKFKDVVFGGGLTNRPFLKNILPVNLSEILDESIQPSNEGGEQVEELLKKLRESLKLAEDADEKAVIEALNKALQEGQKPEGDGDGDGPETLSEEELSKLLAENPAMAAIVEQNKKLAEQNKSLVDRVVNLETTGRQSSVAHKLTEWHAKGLPTALDEKVTAFMLSINEKQSEAFAGIVSELAEKGFVPLKEEGSNRHNRKRGNGADPLAKMDERIKELMEGENGLSYADAVVQFFAENDEAYDAYVMSLGEGGEDE